MSVVELGRVAQVFNGKTPAKGDQRTAGHPVLKIRDIDEHGRFRGFHESFVDSTFAEQFRDRLVRRGDTLILNAAHNADYVASKIALASEGVQNSLATGEWLIVRPTGADPRFVHYWIRSAGTRRSLRDLVKGIHLYPKDVARMLIPVPSPTEQRHIADILDKADAIRRKRKEAIALTEELLRSAFLDMFGDPVTNPKGWSVKPLAELGELDRGRSRHRPRNDPKLLGGPHPLIQTGEVANCDGVIRTFEHTYSDLGLSQSKLWPTGTLCITIAANIAKTGVLGFDACFPDSVVGFTPGDEATTEYVQYWLGFLQPVLERQAPQSAQKNINLEILRTLLVPAPDIAFQRRFSAVVAKIRGSRNRMRDAHDSSEGLFRALVARFFSGSAEARC